MLAGTGQRDTCEKTEKRHGVIRRCRRLTYNSSKQHRKGKEKVKGNEWNQISGAWLS